MKERKFKNTYKNKGLIRGSINWSYVPMYVTSNPDEITKRIQNLNCIKKNSDGSFTKSDYSNKQVNSITSIYTMQNSWYYRNYSTYIQFNIYDNGTPYIIKLNKVRNPKDRIDSVEEVKNVNSDITGKEAFNTYIGIYNELTRKNFYDEYGMGKQYIKKSGYLNNDLWSDLGNWMKLCVPAPLNYANSKYLNIILDSCSKADVSSAFTYGEQFLLPTLKDFDPKLQIWENDFIGPTEEYPFCFYPKQNRLVIYNELDTADIMNRPEYQYSLKNRAKQYKKEREQLEARLSVKLKDKSDDFCIKLKAHELDLPQVNEYIYNLRFDTSLSKEDRDKMKSVLNYFTGYCHCKEHPMFSFISAVAIARCNKRMLDICDKLIERNLEPVLIATDSISWIGLNQPDLTVKKSEKTLGSFVLEYEDCQMLIKGPKLYQIQDGRDVHTMYSGKSKEVTNKFEFGEIRDFVENKDTGTIYIVNENKNFVEVIDK